MRVAASDATPVRVMVTVVSLLPVPPVPVTEAMVVGEE